MIIITIQAGAGQWAGFHPAIQQTGLGATVQGETAGGPAGHAAGQPD